MPENVPFVLRHHGFQRSAPSTCTSAFTSGTNTPVLLCGSLGQESDSADRKSRDTLKHYSTLKSNRCFPLALP